MRRLLYTLALLTQVGPFATLAHSAVVSFDFEDAAGAVIFDNYYSNGFRFSPNTHRDGFAGPTGTWLGWDGYAEPPFPPFATSNPNWLGPASLSPFTNGGQRVDEAWMYIDGIGATFTLESFDLIAYGLDIQSSNGGQRYVGGVSPMSVTFSGNEWTNVNWLLIRAFSPGVPAGLDNLVLRVPEPTSLLLAVSALLLSLASRAYVSRRGHA